MNKKIENFRKIIEEKKLGGILIKGKANKKYIGALTGSGVKVVLTRDNCYQIMDGRYINEAKKMSSKFEILIHNQNQNYIDLVKKILKDNNKLAIESTKISINEYFELQKAGLDLVLLNDDLEFERRCKQEDELSKIKIACEITDSVFKEIIKNIKIGMTERELSALIQYKSIIMGASGMAFDTIVASGERGAMPHARPTDRKFLYGDFITIDFGVIYEGYQSDMTRTVCIGEAKGEILKIYNIVLEAQRLGIKYIKGGIKAKELDKYVREIINDHGYGKYFTHGLGHGIGLGDGDFPIINPDSEIFLEEGMVMSCEPGIYIPNVGGVRIEDDVVIYNGKGVTLNKSNKELIIIDVK